MPSDTGHTPTTNTVDRYLSTIYCIAGEGETVRPGRVATWLGVAAPTVTDAIQRLARDGWVDVAADRSITLTVEGQRAASAIVRRHRLLERWLVDVLAFDWARADEEADALSSGFSDAVIDELDRTLGAPATCPHGNPIPGRDPAYGELTNLATLEPGVRARVRRISEVAEHESKTLLTLLFEHGISEGTTVEVAEPHGDEPVAVRTADGTFSLPVDAAGWIWVERLDPR